jgi:pilus assembly protein CpaF
MLQSRPANIEGRGAITMVDLTRMALRMDPDRVVVGEVRGPEAFPMLMAMSQGNNGSIVESTPFFQLSTQSFSSFFQ